MPPSTFWQRHPLIAWAIEAVVFAAAFAVFLWLTSRSTRMSDDYAAYAGLFSMCAMRLYQRLWRRDQRTRLKPSPFFFWFSGD
jgi:hypothetical protein